MIKKFDEVQWVKTYASCVEKLDALVVEMSDLVSIAAHDKTIKSKYIKKMMSNSTVACITMCEMVEMLKKVKS